MYVDGSYERCLKSVDQLMEGVDQGDPESLYIIGRKMDEGDGLKEDRHAGLDYIQKSAEAGYAPAQNYMGYLHCNGDHVPQDDKAATEWFSKAAEQGHPKAKYNLALLYRDGRGGLAKDVKIYLGLMRESAEAGYPEAQYYLGEAYYYGEGVPKDMFQAVAWYRKAAEQCDSESQYSLGYMYEHGYGVERDYEQAIRWYREASLKGDDHAAYRAGLIIYYKYSGREKEGIEVLKNASDQGSSSACYSLYRIYSNDQNLKDRTEARYWLFKGIDKNDLQCIREAAKLYLSGTALPYNPALAVKCYEKGIGLEDGACMYMLGDIYEHGEHVGKDIDRAMDLMTRAADAGESRAQCRLGDYYLYGDGDDTDLALFWYRRAGINGSVMAMKELARIYEQGVIVTQSIHRAIYWSNRAYINGDELAQRETDRLESCYNPIEPEEEEGMNEKAMRLSVENKSAKECYNLGVRFLEGKDGLDMDLEKSRLWLKLGSDMGNTSCMDNLGFIYYTGRGVEKDLARAEDCFRRAAELGSPYSQAMLGYMYCKGEYLEKDEAEGEKWLKRADRQGYGDMIVDLFEKGDASVENG